jgi:hypothetical protein
VPADVTCGLCRTRHAEATDACPDVWLELYRRARARWLEPVEQPRIVGTGKGQAARHGRPGGDLILATQPAIEVDPPRARAIGIAQRAPRNGQLGGPSAVTDCRARAPGHIPLLVDSLSDQELRIALIAGRRHLEDLSRPLIPKRIEDDGHDIILVEAEIALQVPDAWRLDAHAVAGDERHVDVLRVVGDAHIGWCRCGRPLIHVVLAPPGRRRCLLPDRFVESTIDDHRRPCAHGSDAQRIGRRWKPAGDLQEQCCDEHCGGCGGRSPRIDARQTRTDLSITPDRS